MSTSPSTGYIIFYSNIQRKATAIGNYFTILAGGLNDTKCLVIGKTFFIPTAFIPKIFFLIPKLFPNSKNRKFSIPNETTLYELSVNKSKEKSTGFSGRKSRCFYDFQPIKCNNFNSVILILEHHIFIFLNVCESRNRGEAHRIKISETLINKGCAKKKASLPKQRGW